MNSINSISEALSHERAINSYKSSIKKQLKQADRGSLSADDIYVLLAISNHMHSIKEIAPYLNAERYTVSKSCQRLLKAGLINKTVSKDDKRNFIFNITPAGENLLQRLS
ncbi:MarR family winged helix-turn-helix transcriptional regulator [Brucella gallinifaecis]|uniref:MarR family winged helix-turn-helix transcriptional regulator n=1 Tax=Brucella gallinifaecis TaxID=215590 RepID=UPI00236253E7|nr:winged helix DNA-binding protein [Brucella gallinifaecis]